MSVYDEYELGSVVGGLIFSCAQKGAESGFGVGGHESSSDVHCVIL